MSDSAKNTYLIAGGILLLSGLGFASYKLWIKPVIDKKRNQGDLDDFNRIYKEAGQGYESTYFVSFRAKHDNVKVLNKTGNVLKTAKKGEYLGTVALPLKPVTIHGDSYYVQVEKEVPVRYFLVSDSEEITK